MKIKALLIFCLMAVSVATHAVDLSKPIAGADLVFEEADGLAAVEAEHFFRQTTTEKRAWYIISPGREPGLEPDGDPSHLAGASGGAYLEILPDSRRNHGEKLIRGENFTNEPGELAVLHYKVRINSPGRYYVWVRAYSTGSEDNGIHVGLDGTWPESGRRMQWCAEKNTWRWESRQRTEAEHCGEPYKIYLDIEEPGEHEIMFSMREDGFEFDKFILTKERELTRPIDVGPPSLAARGRVPAAFAAVAGPPSNPRAGATRQAYPAHWGAPPRIQTMDIRPLPGGYGQGSSTLAHWIQWNLDMDAARAKGLVLRATEWNRDGSGYYLDNNKWLAIDPQNNTSAKVDTASPFPSGRYDITLVAVGENDGQSTYQISINGQQIGDYSAPLSEETYEEGMRFSKTFRNVEVNSGDVIEIASQIGSSENDKFSRARWSLLVFKPADEATKAAVANFKPANASSANRTATDGSGPDLVHPRGEDGDGTVEISGELKQWHNVVLTLDGPFAHEGDNHPNPFTDYNFTVNFRHESGWPSYQVPGYFAADGDAANSSAVSGTKWRAHLSPDKTGEWTYMISFTAGEQAALQPSDETTILPFSGTTGSFTVTRSDKHGRDFRAHGRLEYVGEHHLRFAGSGEYFLKAGPDAPETMLAYADIDGTEPGRKRAARSGEAAPTQSLKTWEPHIQDWREGDPTWKDGRGKGLIGGFNYLAAKGLNSVSFLPYNSGGDGDNIWPFVSRHDKMHYDVSKLAQWGIVFEHGTRMGLHLHFKLQENEIDDNRRGQSGGGNPVPESLDGGELGPERKLYVRELVARFAHNLALNWNIGEENTQSIREITDMVKYIHDLDPYGHNIVIHTFPNQQDKVYTPLLGNNSLLTGASLQNHWDAVHQRTLKWVNASRNAGRPWVVANDEQGNASLGVPPDPGYRGFSGMAKEENGREYDLHDIRKSTLWGNLMAGGAGVEYYFGYQLPENDLVAEDWRSRDQSWDYCRIAIDFFRDQKIPFQEMRNANALIGNASHSNEKFCLAKPGTLYLVYLARGGTSNLDLSDVSGTFSVKWFNPREGGKLVNGSVRRVRGGHAVSLGDPPSDVDQDWLVVVR